jgi:hypothetical protein
MTNDEWVGLREIPGTRRIGVRRSIPALASERSFVIFRAIRHLKLVIKS